GTRGQKLKKLVLLACTLAVVGVTSFARLFDEGLEARWEARWNCADGQYSIAPIANASHFRHRSSMRTMLTKRLQSRVCYLAPSPSSQRKPIGYWATTRIRT